MARILLNTKAERITKLVQAGVDTPRIIAETGCCKSYVKKIRRGVQKERDIARRVRWPALVEGDPHEAFAIAMKGRRFNGAAL